MDSKNFVAAAFAIAVAAMFMAIPLGTVPIGFSNVQSDVTNTGNSADIDTLSLFLYSDAECTQPARASSFSEQKMNCEYRMTNIDVNGNPVDDDANDENKTHIMFTIKKCNGTGPEYIEIGNTTYIAINTVLYLVPSKDGSVSVEVSDTCPPDAGFSYAYVINGGEPTTSNTFQVTEETECSVIIYSTWNAMTIGPIDKREITTDYKTYIENMFDRTCTFTLSVASADPKVINTDNSTTVTVKSGKSIIVDPTHGDPNVNIKDTKTAEDETTSEITYTNPGTHQNDGNVIPEGIGITPANYDLSVDGSKMFAIWVDIYVYLHNGHQGGNLSFSLNISLVLNNENGQVTYTFDQDSIKKTSGGKITYQGTGYLKIKSGTTLELTDSKDNCEWFYDESSEGASINVIGSFNSSQQGGADPPKVIMKIITKDA